MDLEEFFKTPEEAEKAKKLVMVFYDKILISSKLSNPDALLFCAYMIANHEKTSSPEIDKVELLFLQSGRTKTDFSKALYELTVRQRPIKLKKTDNKLEFTSAGLERVKKLLEEESI